jgi:ankyrin repeat protein
MQSKTIRSVTSVLIPIFLSIVSFTVLAEPDLRLVEAAKDQNWEAVHALVGDVDINSPQADGATALAWSTYWDNLEAVRLMIRNGSDANASNDYGVTPLILASENGNSSIVKTLLEEGKADPNKAMWNGLTPLMIAARNGFVDLIQLFVNHGTNLDTHENRRNQNALMWAIYFGHPDVARILIEHGADVNVRTTKLDENFQPLELEAYGQSVSVTPEGGYTPLMFAALKGDLITSRLLVENGADVNIVSATDGSALTIASAKSHEKLGLYLLEQGAEANTPDANGMTPLHYTMRVGLNALHGKATNDEARACGFGSENYICIPIEVLTDDERALLDDPTSYLFVVEPKKNSAGHNMLDLAEALLAKRADPDAKMKYPPPDFRLDYSWLNLSGATPLFLAAASQDQTAIEMMLEEGADPLIETSLNEKAFDYETKIGANYNQVIGNASLLMAASGISRRQAFSSSEQNRAVKIVDRLIDLGADVNATNATGWTALHSAAFIGANDLVRLLKKRGAQINVSNGCGQTPISLALATDQEGLPDRAVPRAETAELLLQLGAGDTPPPAPVGKCVLGRGGLEADVDETALIQGRVRAVIEKLERKKQNWANTR